MVVLLLLLLEFVCSKELGKIGVGGGVEGDALEGEVLCLAKSSLACCILPGTAVAHPAHGSIRRQSLLPSLLEGLLMLLCGERWSKASGF